MSQILRLGAWADLGGAQSPCGPGWLRSLRVSASILFDTVDAVGVDATEGGIARPVIAINPCLLLYLVDPANTHVAPIRRF